MLTLACSTPVSQCSLTEPLQWLLPVLLICCESHDRCSLHWGAILKGGTQGCNLNVTATLRWAEFYRSCNSPGCCHFRKVPLYVWSPGCKPLSPDFIWFTACYLLLPLSLWTIWFHLGSQFYLRALCHHNEGRRFCSLPNSPKLCVVSQRKKGRPMVLKL